MSWAAPPPRPGQQRYIVMFSRDGVEVDFQRYFNAVSPGHAQSKALRWFAGRRPGENIGASEGRLDPTP